MSLGPTEALSIKGAEATIHLEAPSFEGRRTAAVGGWRCAQAMAGATLLNQIAADLERRGYGAVLGPMDGDTWRNYRLVTETDGSPPFLMEPQSGPEDLTAFRVAGFAPIAEYVSSRLDLNDLSAFGMEDSAEPGVRLRLWNGEGAEALIDKIYAVSMRAFARNAFFRPIDRAEFDALYAPIFARLDPRFVVLAEERHDLVGFLFGYPNLTEGAKPETAVVKTYASVKRGVGRRMADLFHRRARDMGFRHAIHALMRADNRSRESSDLYGARIFRRYALMGRRL